jgi:hypothetical protein
LFHVSRSLSDIDSFTAANGNVRRAPRSRARTGSVSDYDARY